MLHATPGGPAATVNGDPSSPALPSRLAADAEAVYLEHHDRLFAAVVRSTRDDEVARDIVQETFEAYIRLVAAGPRPDNDLAWLHHVARNRVIDWSRRRARWSGHGATDDGQAEDPMTSVLRREAGRELHAALRGLAPDARRALLLEGQGYRPAEIAPLIGRTGQGTRTLLCRSRRRVAQALEASAA